MAIQTTDFLVVGGGIVGLTLALELKRRHTDSSVTLLEKELACGLHASGRNSGVLHAGFYYSANSLKAQLTRDGNTQLAAYCTERGLPLSRCGKLVVATRAEDLEGLEELQRRGVANGVRLGWLIDPIDRTVTVYRPGRTPEVLVNPATVEGEGPVAGFVLLLNRVFTSPGTARPGN